MFVLMKSKYPINSSKGGKTSLCGANNCELQTGKTTRVGSRRHHQKRIGQRVDFHHGQTWSQTHPTESQ